MKTRRINVYKLRIWRTSYTIDAEKEDVAREIDKDGNRILTNIEITAYLKKPDVNILKDPKIASVNKQRIIREFKYSLMGRTPPEAMYYHVYDQIVQELKTLERNYPQLAKLYVLEKTYDGRDLLGLKISKDVDSDTNSKPGVVFTGVHHAREWPSAETPLHIAQQMLKNYQSDEMMRRRVDEAETWVIPVVNPDGFVYSMTKNNMWRKNRRPITHTGCEEIDKSPGIYGYGVDLNRNYYDGNPDHYHLYRPLTDKPCRTWDDFSATSDNPTSDVYRGPEGASEVEIKSLLDLELGRKNIKGIIDFHCYGRMILHPWGHTRDPPENVAMYKEIGNAMAEKMERKHRVMQSFDLYPASGTSEDAHNANKKISFTFEMGRSFQPGEKEVEEIKNDGLSATMIFLDWILNHRDSL